MFYALSMKRCDCQHVNVNLVLVQVVFYVHIFYDGIVIYRCAFCCYRMQIPDQCLKLDQKI